MPTHNVPFSIRINSEGLFTDRYRVSITLEAGSEVVGLDLTPADVGKEIPVTLASGSYVGTVTAIGPEGSTESDTVPFTVVAVTGAPSKPVFVIVMVSGG